MKKLVTKLKSIRLRIQFMITEMMKFYNLFLENVNVFGYEFSKSALENVAECFEEADNGLKKVNEHSLKKIRKLTKKEEEFRNYCKCIQTKDPKETRKVSDKYNEY